MSDNTKKIVGGAVTTIIAVLIGLVMTHVFQTVNTHAEVLSSHKIEVKTIHRDIDEIKSTLLEIRGDLKQLVRDQNKK